MIHWKFFFLVGLPILLTPLLFMEDDDMITVHKKIPVKSTKFKCAYVFILMGLYWMLEAIPLAITSVLPVVLFPIFGIQSTSSVTSNYMREATMMLMGGLIIAEAVEFCHLHKRVALKILLMVGSSPNKLLFGIMGTTMFLSMWVSNTAATAMMVPLCQAILDELSGEKLTIESQENGNTMDSITESGTNTSNDELVDTCTEVMSKARLQRKLTLEKMFLFGITTASHIGGTGVVTGTGANLILMEFIQKQDICHGHDGKCTDLTFLTWMLFSVPGMLINCLLGWAYLIIFYTGLPFCQKDKKGHEIHDKKENGSDVKNILQQKYRKLGPATFHELAVTFLFFIAVMLWFFRDPRFVKGWAEYVPIVKIKDSTASMFIVVLLFIIPRNRSGFIGGPTDALLEWKYVQDHMPWGILILLGGGFALSDGLESSGLSLWIGGKLSALSEFDDKLVLILAMILTALITEVVSGSATSTIMVPILLSLSRSLNLHPLYLTLPAAACCSYAFLLPMGSPLNSIILGASDGRIRVLDMVKVGAILNTFCIVVLFLINITYGDYFFGYSTYYYPNATILLPTG